MCVSISEYTYICAQFDLCIYIYIYVTECYLCIYIYICISNTSGAQTCSAGSNLAVHIVGNYATNARNRHDQAQRISLS